MKITTLVENTVESNELECEHGFSLYIESKYHKILFDLGQSDLFIKNANKLNIDLSQVDTVILSHGHYDHGGGLPYFLEINKTAKIYINKYAFGRFYSERSNNVYTYIGLDETLEDNPQIIFTDNYLEIDNELELFSNIKGEKFFPANNQRLFKKEKDAYVRDDFIHEQSLIIKENDNSVLIAGCAHKGIVNIVNHIKDFKSQFPTHVIGGFHLYNRSSDLSEPPSVIEGIGLYLKQTGAKYYTCHCTGIKAYQNLKRILENKIEYIVTGKQFTII